MAQRKTSESRERLVSQPHVSASHPNSSKSIASVFPVVRGVVEVNLADILLLSTA